MDARDVAKKAKPAKESGKMEEDFRPVNSETHSPFDQ